MPFSQIYAQDDSIDILRRALLDDQVGHAYLFFGPENIGKQSAALAYAQALNCLDEQARKTGDSCGKCRSCRMIVLGQHPDVRLLTPETTGGKTVIPIDAIRTRIGESSPHPLPVREDALLKPLAGDYKVYILDPANRPGFQEDAGNALLLTLEEPPPHVMFILISSRPSAVMPTLVSRCQPIRFKYAPYQTVLQALAETETLSVEEARAIAGMAAGRIGWALSVAKNPAILALRRTLFEAFDTLIPAGKPAALRLAELLRTLAQQTETGGEDGESDGKVKLSLDRSVRKNLPLILDLVASWWRDQLMTELGHEKMRINVDYADRFDRHKGYMSPEKLQNGLEVILKSRRVIESNANIDLAIEAMWMNILV